MRRIQVMDEKFPSDEIVKVFNSEVSHILHKLDVKLKAENIARWLNNFEDDDRIDALEILDRLRFVSELEQFGIADELVNQVLARIGQECTIYFCPIAKYGKSATQFSYYIAKSPTFQLLERQGRASFLIHKLELEVAAFDEKTVVVFFDDFFGSGGSFKLYYQYFVDTASQKFSKVKHVFAACALYMEQAISKITRIDPRIVIIGDIHEKIFGNLPPMFSNQAQIDKKREISKRYGDSRFLFKGRRRNHSLGYKDSEALLAFPYMPPNNTLPIIWSSNGGWFPLLPRLSDDILKKLSDYKQQLSYAAAKIHLDLPPEFDQFYNLTRQKLIIFGILRMINKRISHPQIALLMGIDMKTFNSFMNIAQEMGYIDESYKLSTKGLNVLDEVLDHVKSYKKEKETNPSIRGIKYMPRKIPQV